MDSPNVPEPQKFMALEERIKILGLKYFPNENVFPLGFLCSTLEALTMQKAGSVDAGWVSRLLRSIGIPYGMLFQVYFDLFETKVQIFGAINDAHVSLTIDVL
jgi:hypothetical protein